MVENLAGVKVVCDEKEKIKMACRSSAATWNFIISSQKFLKVRLYITLKYIRIKCNQ